MRRKETRQATATALPLPNLWARQKTTSPGPRCEHPIFMPVPTCQGTDGGVRTVTAEVHIRCSFSQVNGRTMPPSRGYATLSANRQQWQSMHLPDCQVMSALGVHPTSLTRSRKGGLVQPAIASGRCSTQQCSSAPQVPLRAPPTWEGRRRFHTAMTEVASRTQVQQARRHCQKQRHRS